MNILMISIGDSILLNPVGDSLNRQQEYARTFGHMDMIVFSPKKNMAKEKHYEYLSIYPTNSLNIFTFIADVLIIAKKIYKTKKIDIITTQDPFGTALAGYILKILHKTPFHVQNHSDFLDNILWIKEKPLMFTFLNALAKLMVKKADRLRVVNTKEKEKYLKLKIQPDKIDIAPIAVNIDFWQSPPPKQEIEEFLIKYNIDSKNSILSWAGRPARVKNFPYLFKSVSLVEKHQKIVFLIAGDMKNSFWNLKKFEKQYSIKPIYLGSLTHSELKIMYYITDVYLHTSNYEGFGLVVSDAQACGTVVVSTNTSGSRDIIDNGKSGYLIDGDEEEFSYKILELLRDKKTLSDMESYSKNMMKNKFNREKMFLNIIESIQNAR